MPADTETTDPYALKLPPDLQGDMDMALCQRVHDVINACADRDEDLRSLRWQLEGVSQTVGSEPWPGACEVEHPISRELHTTLCAALYAALKQSPYCLMESVDDEDTDGASSVETLLNTKAQICGYEKALYDTTYIALESRYAPKRIDMVQPITRSFELAQKTPDGQILDPSMVDGEDQSEAQDQIVLSEVPGEKKFQFRAIDPWDFYVYPISAWGPQEDQGCINTIERMWLTSEDLLLGVKDLGYDADAVAEMIERGPAQFDGETGTSRNDELIRDGLNEAVMGQPRESGEWECFCVVGRAPYLLNEQCQPRIPDTLMHVDCEWLCCPALNIVFKQSYSSCPDGLRPYSITCVCPKPNRLLGEGIVSLITAIQDEMTAITRFGINNMNLEGTPAMSVPEAWLTKYAKYKLAPGRLMPRLNGADGGMEPIVWDVGAQALIMPWLQMLDSSAQRIAAAESVNSNMGGKVRKAAEVQFSEAMMQTKFDLFLSNAQRGVMEDFKLMLAYQLQHMSDEDSVVQGGQKTTINKEQAERKFQFIPQANSESASPSLRMQKMQQVAEIVTQYWTQLGPATQIGAQSYCYALYHRLLILAGEKSPQTYIGNPPPAPVPIDPMTGQPEQQGPMGIGAPQDPNQQGQGIQQGYSMVDDQAMQALASAGGGSNGMGGF